jgi:hypothetical protein
MSWKYAGADRFRRRVNLQMEAGASIAACLFSFRSLVFVSGVVVPVAQAEAVEVMWAWNDLCLVTARPYEHQHKSCFCRL